MTSLGAGHIEINGINEMHEIDEIYEIYKRNREHGIFGIIEVSTYDISFLLGILLLIHGDTEPNLGATFSNTQINVIRLLLEEQRKKLLKEHQRSCFFSNIPTLM